MLSKQITEDRNPEASLLTEAAFLRAIGHTISHAALRKHLAAGAIRRIKLGRLTAIPVSEVSRIASEGLPSIHHKKVAA